MSEKLNKIQYYSNVTRNDKFIHHIFGDDYKGYFAEAGATDGVKNSCTNFLEKHLYWRGVLIEPSSKFMQCEKNRPSSRCFKCCLGSVNEVISFVEFDDDELSCTADDLEKLLKFESWQKKQLDGGCPSRKIRVQQRTLDSIFHQVNAPETIDYVALDVEGAEQDALQGINFDQRQISILSMEDERDYSSPSLPLKSRPYPLLTSLGYKRIRNPFDECEGVPWDFWFVHSDFFTEKISLFNDLQYDKYDYEKRQYI